MKTLTEGKFDRLTFLSESVDIRCWIHGKGEDESVSGCGIILMKSDYSLIWIGRHWSWELLQPRCTGVDWIKPLRIGRRLNGSWLNRFSGSAPTNHTTYVPDAWRQWPKPPLILDPRQRAIPGYCEPPQSSQLSKDRPWRLPPRFFSSRQIISHSVSLAACFSADHH